MKRRAKARSLTAVGAAGIFATGMILATSADASTAGDRLNGTAFFDGVDSPVVAVVDVNARINRKGVAQGDFHLNQTQGVAVEMTGDVECLVVEGNKAVAGGTVTSSSNPDVIAVGEAWFQHVEDRGENVDGEDASRTTKAATFDGTCQPFATSPLFEADRGNFRVRDR